MGKRLSHDVLALEHLRIQERVLADAGWEYEAGGDWWLHQGLGWAITSSQPLELKEAYVTGRPRFYRTFKLRVWDIIPGGQPAEQRMISPLDYTTENLAPMGYSKEWIRAALANGTGIVWSVMKVRHGLSEIPEQKNAGTVSGRYTPFKGQTGQKFIPGAARVNPTEPVNFDTGYARQRWSNDQLLVDVIQKSDDFNGIVVENIKERSRAIMHTGTGLVEWEGKDKYFARFAMGHAHKLWEHKLTTDEMIYIVDAMMGDAPTHFRNYRSFVNDYENEHGVKDE